MTDKDQLLQEAERGQVFNGYCEGTLDFKPTYKYNIGTSDYDTSHKVLLLLLIKYAPCPCNIHVLSRLPGDLKDLNVM